MSGPYPPRRRTLGGRGGPVASAGLWTPASDGGAITFWLRPDLASSLTLSGSTITGAANALGGSAKLVQVGSTAMPALHAATFGALPSLRTTVAGGEKLWWVGGPAMGQDVPCTIYTAAKIYSGAGTRYDTFAGMGDPAVANAKAILLGARLTSYNAYPQVASLGAAGGTVDGNVHIAELFYDGAKGFGVRLDGVLVGTGTSGTFDTSGAGGFPSGLGITVASAGFNGNVDLGEAIWKVGVDDIANTVLRWQYERYLAAKFGVAALTDVIGGSVDSLSKASYSSAYPLTGGTPSVYGSTGVGSSSSAYVFQLASQTGMGSWVFTANNQDANPGFTTAQALLVDTATALPSPLRKNNIQIVYGGTNDQTTGVPVATTIANLTALWAAYAAAGATVVAVTLMPFPGWTVSQMNQINDFIRGAVAAGLVPAVCDLAADPVLSGASSGLSVSGSTVTGTCDATNRVATGGAIGHLTDTGQIRFASLLAPILLGLKR